MTIGAIHHVAVVVRAIDEALPRYERLFGWRRSAPRSTSRSRGCASASARRRGGATRVELVEPVDPEGGVARPGDARRGRAPRLPGERRPAGLAALAAAEAELIDSQPRPGAHGRVAFIHPRTLNGVLWELVDRLEEGNP